MRITEQSTIEDLQSLQQTLISERRTIRERLQNVVNALEVKLSEQALNEDIEKLKHKHGVQRLKAAGIESAEAVNGQ